MICFGVYFEDIVDYFVIEGIGGSEYVGVVVVLIDFDVGFVGCCCC